MRWFLCAMLSVLPSFVLAGAWPREEGTSFLSFSFSQTSYSETASSYGSIYFERGLKNDRTLGLKLGRDFADSISFTGFIRVPVLKGRGNSVFALSTGARVTQSEAGLGYFTHTGFSWGKGFSSPLGSGWFNADLGFDYSFGTGEQHLSADGTIGLKPNEKSMLILQIQASQTVGGPAQLNIAPSYVRALSKQLHLEIGAEFGVMGSKSKGAKIGTWYEF